MNVLERGFGSVQEQFKKLRLFRDARTGAESVPLRGPASRPPPKNFLSLFIPTDSPKTSPRTPSSGSLCKVPSENISVGSRSSNASAYDIDSPVSGIKSSSPIPSQGRLVQCAWTLGNFHFPKTPRGPSSPVSSRESLCSSGRSSTTDSLSSVSTMTVLSFECLVCVQGRGESQRVSIDAGTLGQFEIQLGMLLSLDISRHRVDVVTSKLATQLISLEQLSTSTVTQLVVIPQSDAHKIRVNTASRMHMRLCSYRRALLQYKYPILYASDECLTFEINTETTPCACTLTVRPTFAVAATCGLACPGNTNQRNVETISMHLETLNKKGGGLWAISPFGEISMELIHTYTKNAPLDRQSEDHVRQFVSEVIMSRDSVIDMVREAASTNKLFPTLDAYVRVIRKNNLTVLGTSETSVTFSIELDERECRATISIDGGCVRMSTAGLATVEIGCDREALVAHLRSLNSASCGFWNILQNGDVCMELMRPLSCSETHCQAQLVQFLCAVGKSWFDVTQRVKGSPCVSKKSCLDGRVDAVLSMDMGLQSASRGASGGWTSGLDCAGPREDTRVSDSQ